MPSIAIFTAPKAFEGHIGVIQRNAIRSWIQLGEAVEVLLAGDEHGIEEVAAEFGIRWLNVGERNSQGTPLLNAILDQAARAARSELMCYVNADIMLFGDLLNAVQQASMIGGCFLLAGQRWDLSVSQAIDFADGWEAALRSRLESHGRRHRKTGSDYFVYPKRCLAQIPPFALGRAGWDNWMIYDARLRGIPVIDSSAAITAVHQDHDYAHLPGSQPHYRLPESDENVRLAGGRRHMFTLKDADWTLEADRDSVPRRRGWSVRALEANLQLRARSKVAAELIFGFFHPLRALRQWSRAVVSGTEREAAM